MKEETKQTIKNLLQDILNTEIIEVTEISDQTFLEALRIIKGLPEPEQKKALNQLGFIDVPAKVIKDE